MEAPQGFDIATQKFDAAVRGDYPPLPPLEVLKANTAGVTVNSVAGTAVTVTRTSNTRATLGSGTFYKKVIFTISSVSGTFQVGETITEASTSSTGVLEEVSASRMVLKAAISAAFTGGLTLTGGTSTATCTGGASPVHALYDYKGWWVYSYVNSGGTGTGTWSRITAVAAAYVDVDVNNLHASCDRIIICKDKDAGREAMDIDYGSGA